MSDKPRELARREPANPAKLLATHLGRIRSLAAVDEAVAATVRALREAGELDETVIVFTSDNGYLLGEHRYHGKILPYEEALAVPLLVRGPGFAAGATSRQVVTTVDLAPTFLDLAGAAADLLLDGRSLMALLREPESATVPGDTILIQAGPRTPSEDRFGWLYRGVRTTRSNYTVWMTDGSVELYDRWRDPQQLRNLARHSRYAAIEAELHRRMLSLQGCSGQGCHVEHGPLPLESGALVIELVPASRFSRPLVDKGIRAVSGCR